MHPADEFTHIRTQITKLRARAERMRAGVLTGDAPTRSNAHEVVVARQSRRLLQREKLPRHIRDNPTFWQVSQTEVVKVRPVMNLAPDNDDIVLIEE